MPKQPAPTADRRAAKARKAHAAYEQRRMAQQERDAAQHQAAQQPATPDQLQQLVNQLSSRR